MPALSLEERRDWQAVGRVNGTGTRHLTGCTGTLIAPDLVLTAAHCAQQKGPQHALHFIAGLDRGTFIAHRKSIGVAIHPAYSSNADRHRFRFDIAVIKLETPIGQRVVQPIPLLRDDIRRLTQAMLLGYHNRWPNVLNAHPTCPLQRSKGDILFQFECEVIGGNSGGPVITMTPDGPAVIGVIVARGGVDGQVAFSVPVNAWVIQQWQKGLDRHPDTH